MADGELTVKAVGNSSDAERAVASLEKKYDELIAKIGEGASKAKSAAMAAKEAAKQQEKAAAEAARKIRDAERQAEAAKREEKRRSDREAEQSRKKNEREEREKQRAAVAALKDAERQKQAAARESARIKAAQEREAVRAAKQAERDQLRETQTAARERRRIALESSREKKRIIREEAQERKRIEREAAKSERDDQRANAQVQSWLAGLVSVQAAYGLITAGIQEAIQHQQELIRLSDEHGRDQDRRTRSFGVNAGLNLAQAQEATASMNAVAVLTGVGTEQLEPAASGLVGSGFEWQHASGDALQRLVESRAAGGGGGDLGQLASNAALGLNAQGLPKTPESIERFGSNIWALRREGNVEPQDIEFLARQLALAKDQTFEENLALYGTLRDVAPADVSGTAFGAFHKTMRAPSPKAQKVMAGAKLDPKSADFVGESTQTVIRRVAEARNRLPKDEQDDFTTRLFGREFVGPITHLLDNPDRYEELLKAQGDKRGYRDAVKLSQSGIDFAANVTEQEQKQEQAAMVTPQTDEANQRALMRRKHGMTHARSNFIQGVGQAGRYVGIDPWWTEGAAEIATDVYGQFNPFSKPATMPMSLSEDAANVTRGRIGEDAKAFDGPGRVRPKRTFAPPLLPEHHPEPDDSSDSDIGDNQAGFSGRGSRLADEFGRQTEEVKTQTEILNRIATLLEKPDTQRPGTTQPRRARTVNASEVG